MQSMSMRVVLILATIAVFVLGTFTIIKLTVSQQVDSQHMQIKQIQQQIQDEQIQQQIQSHLIQNQQEQIQQLKQQLSKQNQQIQIKQINNEQVESQEKKAAYKRLESALKDAWNDQGSTDDRVLLSKRLNILSMKINQFMCDLDDGITLMGGWCRKHFNNSHATDQKLAAALSEMLKGETVGSFGDGPGAYKELLTKAGLVKQYDAYDGSPYIEDSTDGKVKYLELTIPHFGLPVYDWTISLEVAEHIPATYEDIYLSNVLRHTRKGVILSWAIQSWGTGHVNMRTQEYVEQKMKKLCFDIDQQKSKELREVSTLVWLKSNLMVFHRRNDASCKIDA